MKTSTLLPVIAVSAALLLAGCGSDSSGSGATGQNSDACSQFAAAYNSLAGLAKGPVGSDIPAWTASKNAEVEKMKALSGSASGAVKDRISALVAALPPDTLTLSEPDSDPGQKYVDNAKAVASACASDGTTIALDEFALPKFDN